jgi:hypothetical protein
VAAGLALDLELAVRFELALDLELAVRFELALGLELVVRFELALGLALTLAFDAVAARFDLGVARLPGLDLRWPLFELPLALVARVLLGLLRADVVAFARDAAFDLDAGFAEPLELLLVLGAEPLDDPPARLRGLPCVDLPFAILSPFFGWELPPSATTPYCGTSCKIGEGVPSFTACFSRRAGAASDGCDGCARPAGRPPHGSGR